MQSPHHDKDPTPIKRSMTEPPAPYPHHRHPVPRYNVDARSTPSPQPQQLLTRRHPYMYDRFERASVRSASPAFSAAAASSVSPSVNPFYVLYQTAQRSSNTLMVLAAVLSPLAVAIMAAQPDASAPTKLTVEPAAPAPPLPVTYAGRWVVAGVSYALHTLLRPFYLAGYWVLYLVIVLPVSLAYHTFVAVAPVLGFLLVAAAVGVGVGVCAAWVVSSLTAPSPVEGQAGSHAALPPPPQAAVNPAEQGVEADGKSADANHRPGALSRRRQPKSDFAHINEWFTEEEGEQDQDSMEMEPPLHSALAQRVTDHPTVHYHAHIHDHSVLCTDEEDEEEAEEEEELDQNYQYIDEDMGSDDAVPYTDYDEEELDDDDYEAMPDLQSGVRYSQPATTTTNGTA